MSKKHFSWLLLLTVATLALVLLVPTRTGKESTFERTTLLPELAALVNELDYLKLSSGGSGNVATFERREGSWRVLELSSYPADWSRLKALLSALAAAEVVEEKTSNPEFYSRLGVEDISGDGASGTLIEFAPATGLPALIVGNKATGREGQYVRLAEAQSSALLDRELDLPADRTQWLDQSIIDIADGEVVEVSIRHPDGEEIVATKISADDTDFVLQNLPAEREPKSNWSVNSMAGSMASLTLDEVRAESEIDWDGSVNFQLLTADGLRASANLVKSEDTYWIRLEAFAYQAVAGEIATEEVALSDDVSARAEQINDRVKGWAYQIPQAKFDAMSKRMADLLQPLETP